MKLSAAVLTRNEEEMIENCLKQLKFADEIIVLDQNSTDNTVKIAKKYADKIITSQSDNFDENRQILADSTKGEWLLYVDADERLSEELIQEIKNKVEIGTRTTESSAQYSAFLGPQSSLDSTRTEKCAAFFFPRKNIILGKWLKHGGWWPDYVPRLFKKDKLVTWSGHVHESPKIEGKYGYIKTPLEHYTARSLESMLEKSIKWAKIEAELFYKSNHPKVSILRVAKSLFTEFFIRYFAKGGFLDGQVGLIESIYQGLHRCIILTYLWELQNNANRK